ncbi:MAG: pentapeptide repeat-containing protein [Elainellaceae cyanobacterium]
MRSLFTATTLALLTAALPARAENLEHLQQLLSTRSCQNCDLSGTSFVYTNLSRVDLTGADLSRANLNRTDLTNATLRRANLTNAVLFNANLTGADLSGADLRGADLREAYLMGANLEGALLEGAILRGAVGLPPTVFTAADLYRWGLAEAERGNHRGAIAYYTQSLERRPSVPEIYLSRSVAYYRAGSIQDAVEDANRAAGLYQQQGDTEEQAIAAQFAQGILDEQQALLEGPDPGKPDFMNLLGAVASLLLRFGLPF